MLNWVYAKYQEEPLSRGYFDCYKILPKLPTTVAEETAGVVPLDRE
jgi:hypothetical protein